MLPDPGWLSRALCDGADVNLFYPSGNGAFPAAALEMCGKCPVQRECLEWIIDLEVNDPSYAGSYGVFGGMTGPKRQQIVTKLRRLNRENAA